jgi:hypothetical protein
MFKVRYLFPNDVEAGAPEVDALDVDAEAFGEGNGVGEAGGGEQVVVLGAEGVGCLLVEGVEAEGEQQAEGVRVVVEGRAVVVAFSSLLYVIEIPKYRTVTITLTHCSILLYTLIVQHSAH